MSQLTEEILDLKKMWKLGFTCHNCDNLRVNNKISNL